MAKNEIILCDSNIIIELLRGNVITKNRLQQIGAANIALSIITHAEIYFGAKASEFVETRKVLESFKVCYLSEEISLIFNGIMLNYSLTHRPKDFKFIPEIKFYDPKS